MNFVKAGEMEEKDENIPDIELTETFSGKGKHIDLISAFQPQKLDDIMASSFTILRCISFGIMHTVLGMKPMKHTAADIEELKREQQAQQRRVESMKVDTDKFKAVDFSKDVNQNQDNSKPIVID